MRWKVRPERSKHLVLLWIYMFASNLIFFVFSFNPQGQEGREPLLILTSWAWVAYMAFSASIYPRMHAILSFLSLELFFFLYLSVTSALGHALGRTPRTLVLRRTVSFLVPAIIHLSGTWLLLVKIRYFNYFSTYNSNFRYPAIACLSLVLMLVYRWLDARVSSPMSG